MQGVILGTAAYMSPEQARGKPVYKRTDIWAFGCVLYEMLTGKAAIQGEDVTEILAAVVKSGVNLDLLPANIHTRVREVLSRCLEKDLRKRFQDIGDIRYDFEQILSDPGSLLLPAVAPAETGKSFRRMLLWFAATLVWVMFAAVAVWIFEPTPSPRPRKVMRFTYELPEGQQFNPRMPLAISPDGDRFVYGTTDELYLREMDQLDAKHISGTGKDSLQPFFSPDGK
jgi:serine/threonine protein kinase